MSGRITFVKYVYWFGAIFDGLMLVPLLSARAGAAMLGLTGFDPGADYRYATALAASLMAGWTVLLIWGARAPVERRGVLLITAVPVMVGLLAAGAYAVAVGLVALPYMLPVFLFQLTAIALFTIAYRLAMDCSTRSDLSSDR